MPSQLPAETLLSLSELFTPPPQTQSDGRIVIAQHGPVFGAAVKEFNDLTELLGPSEKLRQWLSGGFAVEATCLFLKNTGRRIEVTEESTVGVPEEILEAAKEALSATEKQALGDAQAAFPDNKCSLAKSALHIGQLLVISGLWHSDGGVLSNESILRATISIPGTRFLPKGSKVSVIDDELTPTMRFPVLDNPSPKPIYSDGTMSYFTKSAVHISPSPEETAALLKEMGLGARPLCSIDIQIDPA